MPEFEEGNQLWKQRSKHGRDIAFSSPTVLWEACCEYFQWVDEHPLIEEDFRGKDIERVELKKMRPYTLYGLCIFLDVNSSWWRDSRARLKNDADFSAVFQKVDEIIYNQKFEGAAAGFFNANIIARELGLVDKKEQELKVVDPLIISFDGDGKTEIQPGNETNQTPPIP